jgi:hypothetical protein
MSLKFLELEHNIVLVDSRKAAFTLRRAKIPGGWLVVLSKIGMASVSEAVTFVPDPDYTWDGNSLPE